MTVHEINRMIGTKKIAFWGIVGAVAATFALSLGGCSSKSGESNASGDSSKAEELVRQGDQALADRDWGRAADLFGQATAAAPDQTIPLYGRSVAALARGKELWLQASVSAESGDLKAAERDAAAADEQFQSAEKDCRRMLEMDAKSVDAHYILGCVALYQGAWDDAIDAFSTVIKIQPENARAYQRRGEVFGFIGDSASETADLNQAAKLGYKTPDVDDVSDEANN